MKKNGFRKGQAIVELVLVLPVFLVVFVAIIDFARVFHSWASVNHQCVEAARVACKRKYLNVAQTLFSSTTHAEAQQVVEAFWKSQSPLTPRDKISGPTLEGVGQNSHFVKISAVFSFEPWTPGVTRLLGRSDTGVIPLTAFAEQQKE